MPLPTDTIGHPGSICRSRLTTFITIWSRVQAVTVCTRPTSRRAAAGKKASLLFHLIIYRHSHLGGHSVNLTYFPRKLLSRKALIFGSWRKAQDAWMGKPWCWKVQEVNSSLAGESASRGNAGNSLQWSRSAGRWDSTEKPHTFCRCKADMFPSALGSGSIAVTG